MLQEQSKFLFRHGKIWTVQKEWDGQNGEGRLTKLVAAYNQEDMAQTYCINLNKECAKCPERTRMKMQYKVLKPIPGSFRYQNKNDSP